MSDQVQAEALSAVLALHALERAGEGIAVIDGDDPAQPMAWINSAFVRVTGFTPAQLVGCSLRVLQGDDQDQPALARLREAMRDGRGCAVELRSYRPDGALYRSHLRIEPFTDDTGRSWWLAYLRDVSEQHEMEVTLGRRTDELDAAQRRLVEIDPIDRVTGLQSEYSFELALELAWFSCARDRRSLALFLFSPDYFNVYLDTFGRIAGDSCLRMVARGIGSAFRRASDVAARLGEAEFAALGMDMEADMLEPHARRVCERVRALAIRNPHAPEGRTLTVSAVVLAGRPGRAPDWRALLDEARETLAKAPATGTEQLIVRSYGDRG